MTPKAIFQIKDVFFIEGRGTVVAGVLKKGIIHKGMETTINGKIAKVISIEQYNRTLDTLWEQGSEAGLLLSGVGKKDVSQGEIYFE